MDAAGKDGTIKHVMSGLNPQGCQVFSFKRPSEEELDHDFLWRYWRALPERGRIGIFNRSYYEEVLVVRVHPEFLERSACPRTARQELLEGSLRGHQRLRAAPARNGTRVLKFFLNISKKEQKKRFLDRLDEPDKHWKFAMGDLHERPSGTTTRRRSRTRSRHQHRLGAVVGHPLRQQVGLAGVGLGHPDRGHPGPGPQAAPDYRSTDGRPGRTRKQLLSESE